MRDDAERTRALQAFGRTDLWAPVSLDGLPRELVDAVEREDWAEAKRLLGPIMDGLSSDGVYGRALLQLVRRLPLGVDPVFDRYRAAAAIDHGDWDDLRECLESSPVAAPELGMLRDALIRSVNDVHGRPTMSPDVAPYVAYEFQLAGRWNWYKHWARRLSQFDAASRFDRPDVPTGRHFRFRMLHHAVLQAAGEAQGGCLATAAGLAREAKHMADDGEPLRDIAADIEALTLLAMGEAAPSRPLATISRTPHATGMSPLGTLEWLLHVMPFLPLLDRDTWLTATDMLQGVAGKLGSPRVQLIADSWTAATRTHSSQEPRQASLAGLTSASRYADVGLRALPTYLRAVASGKYTAFEEAERQARRAGNIWVQVAAWTWRIAIDPSRSGARRFQRLLDATGWRRPVLVPDSVRSDAALGMTSEGVRGRALLELALASGRNTTATEVAFRHAVDETLAEDLRMTGVQALGRIATAHARGRLAKLASETGPVAALAKRQLGNSSHVSGLSPREIEVVNLVGQGLTNAQIAEVLHISQHTAIRHLANARDKIGAASRAEVAVRLGQLTQEIERGGAQST